MSVLVILCSRNGEAYLREQLDSILAQTEPGVRLLISDDRSEDRSAKIGREYAERWPERVFFSRRESPSGSAAKHFMDALLNTAEAAERYFGAPADYFMFADQDDFWHADKAEKTLALMRRAERSAGEARPVLVHCDMRVTDAERNEIAPSYALYQGMSPERTGLNQLLVQNHVTGGAMMINRPLALRLRAHPVPWGAVMHDHWIALAAAAFGKIVFLNEALYDYRQHGNNVLGAAKGGRLREVLNRLGILRKDGKTKKEMDARSREAYRALFRQAECFQEQYGEALSPEQNRRLSAFLSLPGKSRPRKIYTILRFGFTFNRLHRTLGECLFL